MANTTKTVKLTQIKSRSGATQRQIANLKSLGLHRMHQTVEVELNPVTKGMIEGRETTDALLAIMREYFPGFRNARLRTTASRIGIREKEGLCQNGSPADAVLREARQNHSDLCFRLRKMLETDIPQPRDGDIRFFAEQVLGQKV
mgnify:CR=1 FL=1